MAEIIFNCEFVKTQFSRNSNPTSKSINTDDMIKYYERKEACDYSQEQSDSDKTYTVDTNKAFDYYNYRIGSTGGFNRNGNLKEKEANKLIDKYKPKTMYRMVFSFEEDFLSENGFLQKQNIQKLITRSMDKNVRAMGLNPANCEWGAYYHTNTKHPHVHIWLFEKQPTKEYLKLPRSTFRKMRSNVVRTMHINSEIYATRDQSKKELLASLQKLGLDGSLFTKSEKLDKKAFKHDRQFLRMFKDLEKIIPRQGSLKYNSANIYPYREQINKMVEYALSTEPLKDYYQKYLDLLNKEKEMYNNRYYSDREKMEKNKFVENKHKELKDRIANMILQNIKNYRLDCESYHEEKMEHDESGFEGTYSEKLNARNSMHRRSEILDAGILDELSRAIDEASKSNYAIERELHQMVEKARQEILKI